MAQVPDQMPLVSKISAVAQEDATSRRRGMTIQDMLNPSDEEVRQSSRRPTRSLSSSPEIAQKTRVFRPAYSTEEQHFIWYLRIDRGYFWPDLLDAFNARFARPGGGRELSGLQCRYYRLLGQYGIPNVTGRNAEVVQKYGMKATLERAGCSVTYPWLGPICKQPLWPGARRKITASSTLIIERSSEQLFPHHFIVYSALH